MALSYSTTTSTAHFSGWKPLPKSTSFFMGGRASQVGVGLVDFAPSESYLVNSIESGERVKTPVYQGPFTLKRVLMWMKKHSARVQSAWDVISQTGNSAIKEARELATAVPVTTTERPREHPVDVSMVGLSVCCH
jgi:hypothetical protein